MKKLRILLLFSLFFVISVLALSADENVKISATIDPSELIPGEEGILTVVFDIAEGFHQTRSDDFFFISF